MFKYGKRTITKFMCILRVAQEIANGENEGYFNFFEESNWKITFKDQISQIFAFNDILLDEKYANAMNASNRTLALKEYKTIQKMRKRKKEKKLKKPKKMQKPNKLKKQKNKQKKKIKELQSTSLRNHNNHNYHYNNDEMEKETRKNECCHHNKTCYDDELLILRQREDEIFTSNEKMKKKKKKVSFNEEVTVIRYNENVNKNLYESSQNTLDEIREKQRILRKLEEENERLKCKSGKCVHCKRTKKRLDDEMELHELLKQENENFKQELERLRKQQIELRFENMQLESIKDERDRIESKYRSTEQEMLMWSKSKK